MEQLFCVRYYARLLEGKEPKINQHGLWSERHSQSNEAYLTEKLLWVEKEWKIFGTRNTLTGSLSISLNESWKKMVLKIETSIISNKN